MPVPRFTPGQFLHLALDPYDADGFWPDSRVFSIASSPDARTNLAITYAHWGFAKQALDLFERARRIAPDDVDLILHDTLLPSTRI